MAVVIKMTKEEWARDFLRRLGFNRLKWDGKRVVAFDSSGRKYKEDDFLSDSKKDGFRNLEFHLKRTRPFQTSLSKKDPTDHRMVTFALPFTLP